MEIRDEDKSNDDVQELSLTDKFSKLFSLLEHCNEDEQRKKIGEMNEIIDGMNKEEFLYVFTTELFNKMDKMIEENKLTIENSILLTKYVGYCYVLKNMWSSGFNHSELRRRFERMILEEEKKKEEKNENLLVGLCESYLSLKNLLSSELLSICIYYLLKAALNKEESEEAQKDVEMVLLALSNIWQSDILFSYFEHFFKNYFS
ncbi:uncharacterized protein MONOS_18578 [Monocercomonoides exilis]|uniref:uncharacterized protein n=1 Tax=Monocercomonoides exilis TaxID=2049356 RepID=UPI00355ABE44|nr:hypothetical protein MONOS_18578 [Monocercomonoides exilis]